MGCTQIGHVEVAVLHNQHHYCSCAVFSLLQEIFLIRLNECFFECLGFVGWVAALFDEIAVQVGLAYGLSLLRYANVGTEGRGVLSGMPIVYCEERG